MYTAENGLRQKINPTQKDKPNYTQWNFTELKLN